MSQKPPFCEHWCDLVPKHTKNGVCNFQDAADELAEIVRKEERERPVDQQHACEAGKLKHEPLIKRIFADLHEPWMSEHEKASFDAHMMKTVGADLDAQIESAASLGITYDQQQSIIRAVFAQCTKPVASPCLCKP